MKVVPLKPNWRTKQRDRLARDIVKRKLLMWFVRDGTLIEAVPTMKEARDIADNMQMLLDVANGDLDMATANAIAARKNGGHAL